MPYLMTVDRPGTALKVCTGLAAACLITACSGDDTSPASNNVGPSESQIVEQSTQSHMCPENIADILAPIEIPFVSEFRGIEAQPLAAPGDDDEQPDEGTPSEAEDEHIMPGGSAGWGPVSGGYWGLDGQFHEWTDTPPPLPRPLPPQPDDQPPTDSSSPTGSPDVTSSDDEAEAEERRRRIRELEDEMHRILEEMQIMWPLCEDLLQDEFERRREEILRLDPTWTPPGVTPLPPEEEAPPLPPIDEPPELPLDSSSTDN